MLNDEGSLYRAPDGAAICKICYDERAVVVLLKVSCCDSDMGVVNCWRCPHCKTKVLPDGARQPSTDLDSNH